MEEKRPKYVMENVFEWPITELTGYEPKTTFWKDFSIADRFGRSAILDTFNRAFVDWVKADKIYITELVMVLNWKIHQYYQTDKQLAQVYNDLWAKADSYCMDNLKGEDLSYFLNTTD